MDELFSEVFKESEIFSNREVLSQHHIPQTLLFREKQMDAIVKVLTPSLRGERGRNLFLYGKTGTGKTSCMLNIIGKIKELPISRSRISYINCRIYNSRYRVFYNLMRNSCEAATGQTLPIQTRTT